MTRDSLIFFYRGKIQDPDPHRVTSGSDPENGGKVHKKLTVSFTVPDYGSDPETHRQRLW
jgi:hypothetical protein